MKNNKRKLDASIEVVVDCTGNPWLVIGSLGEFQAVQVRAADRVSFTDVAAAVAFAAAQVTPVDDRWNNAKRLAGQP